MGGRGWNQVTTQQMAKEEMDQNDIAPPQEWEMFASECMSPYLRLALLWSRYIDDTPISWKALLKSLVLFVKALNKNEFNDSP